MNCCFVRILFILCLIIATFLGSIGDVSNSELSEVFSSSRFGDYSKGLTRSSGRSLLSHSPSKHDTAIVAAHDGTVYLVDSKSRRVIWSFASGPPIYSSYQASTNHDYDKENASEIQSSYFIDIGDDWQLYGQSGHFDRVKLPMTIEEFVRITPYVSEDRTVILGSKNTTVFVVEAKTGRLLRTHGLPNSGSTFQRDLDEGVLYDKDIKEFLDSGSMNSDPAQPPPLHITRTDYTLQQFAPNSGKVSWSLTVAEFGAVLVCQDDDNQLREDPLNSRYELGSQFDNHFSMPLSCQSKVAVYRIQNRDMFETFFRPDRLLDVNEAIMLPGPESNKMLPPQSKIDNFLNSHHENMILPAPALNSMLPLQPRVDKYSNSRHNVYSEAVDMNSNSRHNDDTEAILPLPPMKINNPGTVDVHNVMMPHNDVSSLSFKRLTAFTIIGFFVVMFFVIYHYVLVPNDQVVLDKQPSNSDSKAVPSKKKKVRKSGKNNGSIEKKDNLISTENEDGFVLGKSDNKTWVNLNKLIEGGADGRRIGKLLVSNTEIAKGSNGTVVLEGVYEGRPVAVKRLVQAHHDVAYKEIQNLIASDRHPNIVRWYGVEYDQDFVYLALERCTCSLGDLIQIYSDSFQKPVIAEDKSTRIMLDYEAHLDSVKGIMQDLNLWKSNGHSSPLLLKLMRDVVSGLVHLHELGIIHRDLKPQNVLIIKERSLCAKLSDMGISRRLLADMSSLGHQASGCGSSGWQAPEQLLHGRQTRAVDLFSLGCVLFFCITGGRHPFGDRLERDINIVKNQKDLFLVENNPEAVDLFSHLLNPDPELRPKALEVLHHPLFWNSEMKLSFLRDTSDRVELEDRETGSDLLKALESIAQTALGVKWDEKMEPAFITNIGHYRRYNYDSVRDLLRVMRNKLNHYRELPKEIQELLGSVPEGFDNYFASRFPKLLIEVYKVVCTYCREEECFRKYFASTV